MYDAYQKLADASDQVRMLAENAHAILSAWSSNPFAPPVRRMTAYYELVALAGFAHSRPDYGIDSVEVRGEAVPVEEKSVTSTPFFASEARLCSFVAIAQGQLPQESWFALGRLLTTAGGDPILLPWSGSMFEYLMPLIVMPTYENTLLHQTYKAAVARQVEYGTKRGVPGVCRNPVTIPSTLVSTISTARLAYLAWASNAGSRTIWLLRRMPRRWR